LISPHRQHHSDLRLDPIPPKTAKKSAPFGFKALPFSGIGAALTADFWFARLENGQNGTIRWQISIVGLLCGTSSTFLLTHFGPRRGEMLKSE
jgi:hypothetical protein